MESLQGTKEWVWNLESTLVLNPGPASFCSLWASHFTLWTSASSLRQGGSTTHLEDLMCGTKEVLCKNTTPLQVLVTVSFSLSGSILKQLHTFHPQNAYVYGNIPRKMTISIFFPGVHISKGQSSEFQRSLCVASVWASSLGNQSSRTHQVNSQQ